MKLSKREARYRTKLIQEWHLTKSEQRMIDKAAEGKGYLSLYVEQKLGIPNGHLAAISLIRASKCLVRAGISAREAADAIGELRAGFSLHDVLLSAQSKADAGGLYEGICD